MEYINGDYVGLYDGVVRIIYKERAITVIKVANGTHEDTFLSLNDCLDMVEYDGEDIVIVILDDATEGTMYKYDFLDNMWYEYGTTRGYY